MGRFLVILLAFILGVSIVAAFAGQALPPQRDDCKLIFVEVDLQDTDFAAYKAYAPLYLCARHDT